VEISSNRVIGLLVVWLVLLLVKLLTFY